MIQRQGKANIPLYVGFFSSNRVLNTNNQESELKLRITNTSESPITFNYDSNATNRSQLIVALEVGDAGTVPWALGTADQVKDVVVSIAGDKWQQTAGPDNKGNTLEWTFTPKSADFQLTSKETLQVVLSKIVTAHPTGTANLYLRYKYVPGYQDGEFICPIEKAPLVFHDVKVKDKLEHRVGIGTSSPSKKFEVVGFGSSEQLVSVIGDNDISLALRSVNTAEVYYELANGKNGTDHSWKIGTNDDYKLHFGYGKVGSFNDNEKMTILTTGNVGIGTTSPEAQLHVTETIQAKKIVADGAVFTGMILMWSGAADKIPTGWTLCNGQKGTPDLRDRFLVGAGSSKYPVGKTGGEEKVKLEIGHMPSHNHGVNDPGHTHSIEMRDSSSDVDPSSLPLYARNNINDSNRKGTNSAKTGISLLNTGDGQAHENLPPYYALCFIMKVPLS
jgi:microcystin-dependent protein